MIEITDQDVAAEKTLAKAVANDGIIQSIRDANLTRNVCNIARRVIKLHEELGEHAEAYLNVTSAGNGKKKSWDDVREEAADLLIVAVDVALTPIHSYDSIERMEAELVQSLKGYTINQRSQFTRQVTSTFADYEALTLKVGSLVGDLSSKSLGGGTVAAFNLVGAAFMLALVPLPDQADWTAEKLEDQLVNTISVKLAKWRNNRDTGTAATDAE